jgi:hypothetical protein
MTIQTSTGLRSKMLDTSPLKTLLAAGFIKIYAGTIPATADADIGAATLLATIYSNGSSAGINFDTAAAAGVLAKAPGETWDNHTSGNVASGTATFYRHVPASNTTTLSTTEARIQGIVGVAGADLNLTSTTLSSGATQIIDYYSVSLPTA